MCVMLDRRYTWLCVHAYLSNVGMTLMIIGLRRLLINMHSNSTSQCIHKLAPVCPMRALQEALFLGN